MLACHMGRRQLDDERPDSGLDAFSRSAGPDLRFGHEGLSSSVGVSEGPRNIDAGGVTPRRTPGDNTLEIAIEAAPG